MVHKQPKSPTKPLPTKTPVAEATSKSILNSRYATSKQELMALINNIRSTGASVDVDLPTVVVAGNQSSGKSSLIEAIFGIKLPRAAGTCTRVPIEIRREVNEQGEDDANDQKPEVDFGPILIDPDQVEATIRRAQLSILNPSVLPQNFVSYQLPEEEVERPLASTKQLAFSRNVVVLEITGPNVTDLTLVDLPGIIQSVGHGEDKNNIQLVENLVKSYISKDCLILLVITMKDDIQNQKAVLLANEADPTHKRTIGVLTKVDTLRGREFALWLKVLKKETEPLLHRYYVTRQPNADEIAEGISFDVARSNENYFFAKTQPWKDLPHEWNSRLGTRNLTASLSDQLLNFIREKLPTLISNINSKYEDIRRDLRALGNEPSNDPSSEMLGLVNDFVSGLSADMMGGPGRKAFIQDVNAAYKEYKAEVWATAPRFTPFTNAQITQDVETPKRLNLDLSGAVTEIEKEGAGSIAKKVKIMNLDDIRRHIEKSITRELPNNVPFAAKAQLIRIFTATWGDLASDLLANVKPLMENLLDEAITSVFGKYDAGMLPSQINETVKELMETLASKTQTLIDTIVALEQRPFTQNDHYLNDLKAKVLGRMRDERYPKKVVAQGQAYEQNMFNTLAQLAQVGYPGTKEDDLVRLRKVDDYETELEVMAEIRAYWQVAFKRIIDDIPRLIDSQLIVPAAKEIQKALLVDLKIFAPDGADRCRAFLGESDTQRRRREDLNERKARLGEAKDAIKKFRAK